MAFRNVAVPWLSGGLIVLGYAAFSWLRVQRARHGRPRLKAGQQDAVEPLAARLEHVSDEFVLDLESDPLPANNNALSRRAELGALFLGRASDALSSFHFGGKF